MRGSVLAVNRLNRVTILYAKQGADSTAWAGARAQDVPFMGIHAVSTQEIKALLQTNRPANAHNF